MHLHKKEVHGDGLQWMRMRGDKYTRENACFSMEVKKSKILCEECVGRPHANLCGNHPSQFFVWGFVRVFLTGVMGVFNRSDGDGDLRTKFNSTDIQAQKSFSSAIY